MARARIGFNWLSLTAVETRLGESGQQVELGTPMTIGHLMSIPTAITKAGFKDDDSKSYGSSSIGTVSLAVGRVPRHALP